MTSPNKTKVGALQALFAVLLVKNVVAKAVARYLSLMPTSWILYRPPYAFVPLPGMFLPIRMSERPTLRSSIADYVNLIIGLFIATLIGGILYYILSQMNSSNVTIPSTVNVLKYVFNFNSIIGLLFAMVIVVIATVLIIRYLRHTQEGWE
jgi:hypothetical protein